MRRTDIDMHVRAPASRRRHEDAWASMDDPTLLSRSSNDAEAFRELYRRHGSDVRRFFERRVDDRQAVVDLTAETFAALYRTRNRYREDRGAVVQWLFGIARTELSRYRRHRTIEARATRRLGVAVPVVGLSDDVLDRAVERLDSELRSPALRSALARLNPAEREIVELRVVHELSVSEVARRLGCSTGAARVRAHRALRRLRRLVDQEEAG